MKRRLTLLVLTLALLLLGALGCGTSDKRQPTESIPSPPTTTMTPSPEAPTQRDFNFIFRYGVGARNELDTFKGTFIKDMITEPSITVPMALTDEEMRAVQTKIAEISFFNYPDVFRVTVPAGQPTGEVTPNMTYYFKVQSGPTVKELRWADIIVNKDEKADRLRELTTLIIKIIESHEEYQKLPKPKGGYI